MITPGLLSITFRNLSPEEIVPLCVETGLKGIEWGGDLHVPHGDLKQAKRIRRLTEHAGLQVAAYGSYYHAAGSAPTNPDFKGVLDSCQALGAPVLRVWAGKGGSSQMPEDQRDRVVDDLRRIADLAAELDIKIVLEYHNGTLTDSVDSAKRLIEQVTHPNVRLLWQPPNGMDPNQALNELRQVASYVTNLHVFHWTVEQNEIIRHPLAQGRPAWQNYLEEAHTWPGDRFAMLEFVKDDSVKQFKQDAATLIGWLNRVQAK